MPMLDILESHGNQPVLGIRVSQGNNANARMLDSPIIKNYYSLGEQSRK
jgi:hypothetical protein